MKHLLHELRDDEGGSRWTPRRPPRRLESLDTAAHPLAVAENIAVFQGWQARHLTPAIPEGTGLPPRRDG